MRIISKFLCFALCNLATRVLADVNSVVREVPSLPYVLNTEKAGKPTSKVAYKFADRDLAQTGISIRPDGTVSIDTRFENGKSEEGDHFYCRIELLDGDQKIIAAARQEAALRGGRERTVAVKTKLTAAQVAKVKTVRLTYGHFDLTGDENFWKQLRETTRAEGSPVGDFTLFGS